MIAVVVALVTVFVVASYWKSNEWVNPISVIVGWWGLWLTVANINPVNLYVPSPYTQFLYLLMLGSAVVGGLLARPLEAKSVAIENEYLIKKWRWGVIVIIPVALIILFLFYKAYSTYLTDITSVAREDMFGDDRLLFTGQNAFLIYSAVVPPVLIGSLIASLALFIANNKRWPITIVSLLYVLESVMMLGRRDIYFLLFLAFFALFVMVRKDASQSVRRSRRYGVLVALGVTVMLFVITSWRLGGEFDVQEVTERYVVEYHTGGFTIFDQERQDPDSFLNRHIGLGRATLGIIEQSVALLVFRKIDESARSLNNDIGSDLNEFRKIGPGDGPPGTHMNAYNTIIYSLYIDGREVGIALISILWGYFAMGHYIAWRTQRRIHSFMVCMLMVGIAFMGLFNSPLAGSDFWGSMIFICGVNRVKLKIPAIT